MQSLRSRSAFAFVHSIFMDGPASTPRIESFANAIGLTQMLIKTAKRFANNAPVTRDVLMDPAKNLEIGSRFLGFLWKHFGGAPPLAIAGYNAGEGAVDRWLGDHAYAGLAMDEFMETIPYDETRNYTKRVLASYFAYCWLYASAGAGPRISTAAGARRARAGGTSRGRARAPPTSAASGTRFPLFLLLAPEETAALGIDPLAAGGGVGAQVLLLLGRQRRRHLQLEVRDHIAGAALFQARHAPYRAAATCRPAGCRRGSRSRPRPRSSAR